MAKVKTPIISLSAKGSLAGSTTFQKRHSLSIVRSKPLPSQPDSLPQIYQRWDFQDYIIQWHNLTQAQKNAFRAAASRNHSTPYAEFLRTKLATLPDIVARWHLDERTGTTAYDSSRNSHHLTIVGPTHVPGIIDHALHFDGLDDFCWIATRPPFAFTESFTLRVKGYLETFDDNPTLISTQDAAASGYTLAVSTGAKLVLRVNGLTPTLAVSNAIVTLDGWRDFAGIYDSENDKLLLYYEGVEVKSVNVTGTPVVPTKNFYLGRYAATGADYLEGFLDEAVVHEGVRLPANILKDSKRRYP